MKKQTLFIYGVVAAACIAGGVAFGVARHTPAAPLPAAVSQLLGETLPDAQGASQNLKQWQGKVLVVNFWATWCAPCVKEMPELSALQTELAPRKIQILGVGIDSPANIAEFAAKYKITYPLYAAGMGGARLTRAFGNNAGGLPFTVVIDADGQIRKTYLGQLDIAELRRDLQSF